MNLKDKATVELPIIIPNSISGQHSFTRNLKLDQTKYGNRDPQSPRQ